MWWTVATARSFRVGGADHSLDGGRLGRGISRRAGPAPVQQAGGGPGVPANRRGANRRRGEGRWGRYECARSVAARPGIKAGGGRAVAGSCRIFISGRACAWDRPSNATRNLIHVVVRNHFPCGRLFGGLTTREVAMRIRTYRDETHSQHVDLIGAEWSVDLVSMSAATLLVAGFVSALWAQLVG
jgi:hypothetical protein